MKTLAGTAVVVKFLAMMTPPFAAGVYVGCGYGKAAAVQRVGGPFYPGSVQITAPDPVIQAIKTVAIASLSLLLFGLEGGLAMTAGTAVGYKVCASLIPMD